ncbi:hypothetical protein FRC11_008614 [Ceratobasidium sp. 423]|nr:hypothetical protein FRC11_008614 [Ceratobasidium sp. 423]
MAMFLNASMPGAWIVDTFPFLRYLPWTSFKAKAKQWSKLLDAYNNIPMNFVYEKMKTGDGKPCLAARWVEREVDGKGGEKDLIEDNKSLIKWASSALVLAGSDTTASAVTTFFALMTLHPEVQAKAQAEIARVIGNDRLPTYSDRDSLPYIEAVYKEVLRWHPAVPIGLPHLMTAAVDDEFRGRRSSPTSYFGLTLDEGMRIPRGSVVFAMIGNMLYNPQMYPDPHIFNPERFTGPPENMERNPENIIFGFGRSHIEPYKCTITPRSPKAVSLIEEAPEMVI